MTRNIVWVEEPRFRGFACSECSWRFDYSAPAGKSFDEMMRNFQLQRDKEFASHVCADRPRTRIRNTQFKTAPAEEDRPNTNGT
jgi:hypothetical protein